MRPAIKVPPKLPYTLGFYPLIAWRVYPITHNTAKFELNSSCWNAAPQGAEQMIGYLTNILKGSQWFCKTGKPVTSHQFGKWPFEDNKNDNYRVNAFVDSLPVHESPIHKGGKLNVVAKRVFLFNAGYVYPPTFQI